jgi:hypothetical protein
MTKIDKPVQSGFSMVPKNIWIDGPGLLWDGTDFIYTPPGSGMLSRFVELCTASDDEILSYAKKWGVLGLCEHGLPASHNKHPGGAQKWRVLGVAQQGIVSCMPVALTIGGMIYFDSISQWRLWSRKAKAIWNIGQQTNGGRTGLSEDWNAIGLWPDHALPWEPGIDSARLTLGREISRWIDMGQVRPHFEWSQKNNQWEISIRAHGFPNLFGLLANALMLAVSDKDGYSVCSNCHSWYIPGRQPSANRRNYCTREDCKKAAWRDSQRQRRKRLEE